MSKKNYTHTTISIDDVFKCIKSSPTSLATIVVLYLVLFGSTMVVFVSTSRGQFFTSFHLVCIWFCYICITRWQLHLVHFSNEVTCPIFFYPVARGNSFTSCAFVCEMPSSATKLQNSPRLWIETNTSSDPWQVTYDIFYLIWQNPFTLLIKKFQRTISSCWVTENNSYLCLDKRSYLLQALQYAK